jgi:mycoredoxin
MTDSPAITMYGADWCRDCLRSKALLDRLGVAYDYVDTEEGDNAQRAQQVSGRMQIPVVVFPDGTHQVEPTDPELQSKLAELSLV